MGWVQGYGMKLVTLKLICISQSYVKYFNKSNSHIKHGTQTKKVHINVESPYDIFTGLLEGISYQW